MIGVGVEGFHSTSAFRNAEEEMTGCSDWKDFMKAANISIKYLSNYSAGTISRNLILFQSILWRVVLKHPKP